MKVVRFFSLILLGVFLLSVVSFGAAIGKRPEDGGANDKRKAFDRYVFVSGASGTPYNFYLNDTSGMTEPRPLTAFPQNVFSTAEGSKSIPRVPAVSYDGGQLAYTMLVRSGGEGLDEDQVYLVLLNIESALKNPVTDYTPLKDQDGQEITGALPSWNPVDDSWVFLSFSRRPTKPQLDDVQQVNTITYEGQKVEQPTWLFFSKTADNLVVQEEPDPQGDEGESGESSNSSGCAMVIKKINSDHFVSMELSNPFLKNPPGEKWQYGRVSISPVRDTESPYFRQMVFSMRRDKSQKYDLYLKQVGDLKLGSIVNLTNTSGSDEGEPSFSNDGTQFVFTRSDETGDQVWLADLDLSSGPGNISHQRKLTSIGKNNNPCFTQLGKVLFVSDRDGNREIYMVDPDLEAPPINLTNSPADDRELGCGGIVKLILRDSS